MNLKTQLHVGMVDPLIKVNTPITQHLSCKGIGGLYTSTYLGKKLGSDWVQWCIGNDFHVPENGIWKGYLIEINKDAKIFIVNSLEDMHYLFDTYSSPMLERLSLEQIDFNKMAEDYDGIHMTMHGERVTRHPFLFGDDRGGMRSMYGWDVESTHFFRNVFDSISSIELITKVGEEDEL